MLKIVHRDTWAWIVPQLKFLKLIPKSYQKILVTRAMAHNYVQFQEKWFYSNKKCSGISLNFFISNTFLELLGRQDQSLLPGLQLAL